MGWSAQRLKPRIATMPALGVCSVLALLATMAMVALLCAPGASAQQPPAVQPRPAPKTQPKPLAPNASPAQPQQGQAAARTAQEMAVVYSPWIKLCHKEQTPAGEKDLCSTQMMARLDTGRLLAAATLIEIRGEATKVMRVTLPLGILLPQGARFAVDKDEPVGAPYITCRPAGCIAQREVNAEFVAKLKKGQVLVLQGVNPAGQVATYQLPLTDFAKANEGPPTDPEALLAQQRRLEHGLQERARKARENLERQSPAQGDRGR